MLGGRGITERWVLDKEQELARQRGRGGRTISIREISINTGIQVCNCLVPLLLRIKVTLEKSRAGLKWQSRGGVACWRASGVRVRSLDAVL